MEIKVNMAEFFEPDDPVHYLRELVDELDIGLLESRYQSVGQRAYPPRVLLRILFYGYAQGIRSGGKLARACRTDIRFIYLAEGLRPTKSTLNAFRRVHHEHFEKLFKQVVQQAMSRGLTQTDKAYGDGTKIRANASKKRSKTAGQYEKWLGHLQADLDQLREELASQQDQEPSESGDEPVEPSGLSKQKEFQKKKALRDRILKAKQELEEHQDEDTQLNLTDADAHFMKGKKHNKDTFYNAQASVSEQQFILHNDVCTSSSDKGQLRSAIQGVEYNTGRPLKAAIFDAGYSSFNNEEYLEEHGVSGFIPDQNFGKTFADQPFHYTHFHYDQQADRFLCPEGKPLVFWRHKKEKGLRWKIYQGQCCGHCPLRQQCTKAKARTIAREERHHLRQQMRQRLQSEQGRQIYAKRKHLIEPIFGHLFRNLGYTFFLVRGLQMVKAEFNLMCTAYNLMKIARHMAKNGPVELSKGLKKAFGQLEKLRKSICQRTWSLNRTISYALNFY